MTSEKINKLRSQLKEIYFQKSKDLPYHGWHHISFVTKKAVDFAESIDADVYYVESAALVHDLNYLVKRKSKSNAGIDIREEMLRKVDFALEEIEKIETIIRESCITVRDESILVESKALSDADTLFKSLPVTPILFAEKYMKENGVDLVELAEKITREQNAIYSKGIYFYTDLAKSNYLAWAKLNLDLWNQVVEALKDDDIKEMLNTAKLLHVL